MTQRMPVLKVGGVPEHFNLPFTQFGDVLDREANLHIEFHEIKGGTGEMLQALRSAEIDVALGLTESLAASAMRGSPVRICGTYVASPLIWAVAAKASTKLSMGGDLRNARVGISRIGSGSHTMAYLLADQCGFKGTEFQFVELRNIAGLRNGVAEDEVDIFMWETHMLQPYFDSGELKKLGEVPTPWPAFCMAIDEEHLTDKKRDAIKQLFRALPTACNAFVEDKTRASQLIVEGFGLSELAAQSWLGDVRYTEKPERVDRNMLDAVITTLTSMGAIQDHKMTVDEIIDTKLATVE